MANGKIRYTVIALTRKEIDDVVENLTTETEKGPLADWLKEKKEWYKDSPKDWKPYGKRTIDDILGKEDYIFQPIVNSDASNYEDFAGAGVQLFIIDPFITFLPKYQNLAMALDLYISEGDKNKCCFIEPYPDLPGLKKDYQGCWKAIFKIFPKGTGHRTVNEEMVLEGFKNELIKTLNNLNMPNHETYYVVGHVTGPDGEFPKFQFKR